MINKFSPAPPREKIVPCDQDQTCNPVSCEECLKQMPTTEMVRIEVKDYIHHFCGPDCLAQWQQRKIK